MRAFDVVASLHGLFTQIQSKTSWGRYYLRNIAQPFALYLAPFSQYVAKGYYFTPDDIEQISEVIREELREQLTIRVKEIQTLLI